MKQIKGFPNYSITTNGKVWSHIRNKRLKPYKDSGGHYQVRLYVSSSKSYDKLVHRLILETFVSSCPDGMECRHLDGNPENNNINNLRWGTRSENIQDSIKHGTHSCLRQGELSNRHKLTEQDVRMIIYIHRTNLFLQREIAEMYNVTRRNISSIINKRTWKHLWEEKK